jgi:hypothetical protein
MPERGPGKKSARLKLTKRRKSGEDQSSGCAASGGRCVVVRRQGWKGVHGVPAVVRADFWRGPSLRGQTLRGFGEVRARYEAAASA